VSIKTNHKTGGTYIVKRQKNIAGKSDSVKVLKLAHSIILEGELVTFRLKQENYDKIKEFDVNWNEPCRVSTK
jgi:hypothetical protein